jgi:hypothetical protein
MLRQVRCLLLVVPVHVPSSGRRHQWRRGVRSGSWFTSKRYSTRAAKLMIDSAANLQLIHTYFVVFTVVFTVVFIVRVFVLF